MLLLTVIAYRKHVGSSLGIVTPCFSSMTEVVACDTSLDLGADDYTTYPIQLIPVLAMCCCCGSPADGTPAGKRGREERAYSWKSQLSIGVAGVAPRPLRACEQPGTVAKVKVRSPPEEDSAVAGLVQELKDLSCLHWEGDL